MSLAMDHYEACRGSVPTNHYHLFAERNRMCAKLGDCDTRPNEMLGCSPSVLDALPLSPHHCESCEYVRRD